MTQLVSKARRSLDYVIERLTAWGVWNNRERGHGLGYPRCAAFMNMLPPDDYGSRLPGDVNIEALEIEKVVNQLPPEFQCVLRQHYAKGGSVEQKMAACKIVCTATYYRRKDRGELMVRNLLTR